MSRISIRDASISFPILTSRSKSLTNSIAELAVGGNFRRGNKGHTLLSALSNINLELVDGDRMGLVGHNGSGKSTFLRTVAGVYAPTSGIVKTEGRVGSLVDLLIGVNGEATGRENIYTRAALLGVPRKEIASLYSQVVDFSGLGDFIEMPLRTYSSGMLLRLAFSVATSVKSDILLMDEWLAVGDDEFRIRAEAKLHEIIQENKILVLASHSRELIEGLCNKVLWLDHGQVKMFGRVEDVCDLYFGKRDVSSS